MKLSVNDPRWEIFNAEPNSGSYKGFELAGPMKTKSNAAKLTFSDGDKEVFATGDSLEDAFIKAFDMIDSYEKD